MLAEVAVDMASKMCEIIPFFKANVIYSAYL